MNALVWVNGEVSRPEEAKVSVFDRGFLFGDGVYETGRTYDGRVLFHTDHLTRLRSSAGKLKIEIPWDDNYLRATLFQVLKAFGQPDAYFRTIVTRGQIASIGLDNFDVKEPTLVHLVQALDPKKLEQRRKDGVHVLTSKIVRNASNAQDPNIKTSNYLNSLLALQDVKARGAEDAILCDASGIVAEGTTFSVFGIRADGVLITPSLDVGILDSITRRHALEVAKPLAVAEGRFSVPEFLECREAFIASSVREIVPIRKWDNRTFSEVPGEQTLALHARFRAAVHQSLEKEPSFL